MSLLKATQPQWFKLDSVHSTNVFLREKVRVGETSLAAAWALEQHAGRGRLGRTWLSPEGGLYLSLSCPVHPSLSPTLYSVAVGVAAAEVLHEEYTTDIWLKWPNDFILPSEEKSTHDTKMGGILAEYVLDAPQAPHVVVGLGMNVNTQVSLPEGDSGLRPTSLQELLGTSLSVETLAEAVGNRVFVMWEALSSGHLRQFDLVLRWKEKLNTLGRQVRVETPTETIEGLARDIASNLALILEDEHGTQRTIQTGDCMHLRPTSSG